METRRLCDVLINVKLIVTNGIYTKDVHALHMRTHKINDGVHLIKLIASPNLFRLEWQFVKLHWIIYIEILVDDVGTFTHTPLIAIAIFLSHTNNLKAHRIFYVYSFQSFNSTSTVWIVIDMNDAQHHSFWIVALPRTCALVFMISH